MQINITVDLEWLGEEGDIDANIKGQIVDGVVGRISQTAIEEVTKAARAAVAQHVQGAISDQVNRITAELLDGTFDITDRWGEVKTKNTSVKQELKRELDTFLTQRVDKDGRTDNTYGATDTRLNWLLKHNLDDKYQELKKQVEQVGKQVSDGLKSYVDSLLKAQLGEGIAKAIGLDAIVNGKK